jgi:hypothetical protein
MVTYIAALMAQDVMRQQFQMGPLRGEVEAPKMRWRLSVAVWTQPLAVALRAAAEKLEAMEQPEYA